MSKRILHHPEIPADEATASWRSVGQLEDTPVFREWLDREFPRGAAELANQDQNETSRRSFMKLMGASTALAGFGMVACRRPEGYIIPYTKAPEWVIPGNATYYATSMPRANGATPLVVTTFEGRPTKVTKNSLHPDSEGTDAFAQASVLDLYSTSRSRVIFNSGKASSLVAFEKALAAISTDKGAKIGFVFGSDDSPTRTRLIKDLAKKFTSAKFYKYEALTSNSSELAVGPNVKLVADFTKADRILSLDCDFAGNDPQGAVTPFFDRRKPEGKNYTEKPDESKMNRLYVAESAFSLTGGMADHRLRVAPSQVGSLAAYIAKKLGVAVPAGTSEITDANQIGWLDGVVADLQSHKGASLVLPGSRQSAAVHALAFSINSALANIGIGKPLMALNTEMGTFGGIVDLKSDIDSKLVEHLILLTPANPIYDAPADLKFSDSYSKLKSSIHLGLRTDATAAASTWHIPASHYLESWADAKTYTGMHSVVQPMILPLYDDCVSELELLTAFLDEASKLKVGHYEEGKPSVAYDAVRKTFSDSFGADEALWKKYLRDGFMPKSSYQATKATVKDLAAVAAMPVPTKDSLEVIFATDSSLYDGRWIDNGWLQEAPDPISKLTWDNAALISPKTAKELGIYDQIIELETAFASKSPDGEGENRKSPMILVEINGVALEIPVLVSFGQADHTIVIPLGYGQGFDKHDELKRDTKNNSHVGFVGVNRGFNAYPLRTSATSYFATGAKVKLTGKRYSVAITQEHNAMYGRALAREVSTLKDDQKGSFSEQLANVAKQGNDSHAPPNLSLYKPEDRAGKPLINDPLHQWGMSIDLTSCMGCNACLVACQSENNIPIVGKNEVARGREMHWIRMDRYFASQVYALDSHGNKIKEKDGSYQKNPDWVIENPAMVPQPVACVQCESAPCETVCPVNATIHTEDGLNAMAYNRCIGTRYCANNCPYKARRFNYFDYNKRNPLIAHNLYKGPFGEKQVGEAQHLQKNPNVTVRMRGVMEKCTYCVQRLKDAVIRQKRNQKEEASLAGKPSTEMQVNINTLRIPVDSVKTACQDACPANAISFGNLLDGDKSIMVRSKHIERNYDLLNYIGTRPRTSYLARVKNPNPLMPDAQFIGKATVHMS